MKVEFYVGGVCVHLSQPTVHLYLKGVQIQTCIALCKHHKKVVYISTNVEPSNLMFDHF